MVGFGDVGGATLMTSFRGDVPLTRSAPGLLVAAGCATAGQAAHGAWSSVPLLVVPFFLSAVIGSLGLLPSSARPGLSLAATRLLRAGIVLLGLQLAVGDLVKLGGARLAGVVLVVATTYAVVRWTGRRLGVGDDLSTLLAAGFSICGVSAIAAVRSTMHAREEDVAYAVTLVTLCGSGAIVLLPVVGRILGLEEVTYGAWIGASVHDVAQVVAAASTSGEAALRVATVVKLTRVLMLGPMVAITARLVRSHRVPVGKAVGNDTAGREAIDGGPARRPPMIPLFVAGFLAAVVVRSTGAVPLVALDVGAGAQDWLLGMAMAGLGAGVDIRRILRVGAGPLVLASISWAWIAAASLAVVAVAW